MWKSLIWWLHRTKKKSFFVADKRWPGQGHHDTNQEPYRVGTISTPGIIFFGKGWPARCSRDTAMVAVFRLASSHPDRSPVEVVRKM
jgi:hypothetical protein